MQTHALCLALCLGAATVQASPMVWTLNTNMTRFAVNAATNAALPIANSPFQSDSLAVSSAGTLYSADANGMIWDVTGAFQIPVGPTSRTQIGDLVAAGTGLWGFSNASQELFHFDLISPGVTSAQVITGLGGSTITGVAHEASTGDIYLSGVTAGPNPDVLFRVPNSATAATTVGPMIHGDSTSYISDIEFDASGTLYAGTWYHRWFYSVSTATAATSFLSAGPHVDMTAIAIVVPEPSTLALAVAGLAGAAWRAGGRRASR